jgi:hypothetical protein
MSEQLALEMPKVQEQALKRAIAMLDSMKCSYAIIDPLGNKHGLLDIKEPTIRSGGRKHPHGERSGYVRNFIYAMVVGDIIDVPFGKYDALDVQSSCTSAAHNMWGKGSVTTTINRPKSVVEIMRVL